MSEAVRRLVEAAQLSVLVHSETFSKRDFGLVLMTNCVEDLEAAIAAVEAELNQQKQDIEGTR